MNSKPVKIIAGLLACFILFYMGYQVYSYISSPYKTETVFESVVADSVEASGMIFRDEVLIKAKKSQNGIISYYYPNGSKVAKNAAVAVIYNSSEDLEKTYKIEQLKKEIETLKECKSSNSGTTQNDLLASQLASGQLELVEKIDNHDLSAISDSKFAILKTLNKVQLLTGKLKNLNSRITKLKNQMNNLKSSLSSAKNTVNASASGFFVDKANGYEDLNGFSKAKNQTEKSLNEALSKMQPAADGVVGKVITSYEWRFVMFVDKTEATKFTQGQEINAVFSSFADETVEAQIEKVGEPNSGGRVMIIIRSDLMDENIASLGSDKVKISFKNNTGLKVSKKALYIENGVKGVYCLLGKDVMFKKVDIIYETDDFFLSAQHSDDSDYLKIYDDVIIKGKDLYDKQKA